jgi:cbb3-type cytochrome oxidase subunit 1
MSEYKDRLEVAKKSYVTTEGVGECGVRLWWCVKQVAHSYTNMDVENLRVLFPKFMTKPVFHRRIPSLAFKDWAYIVGHVTQFFIVPTIVMEIIVRRKFGS